MSISYNHKIPADGNPEGIVDAPLGACFYKNGSFYKVNYSGSAAAGWVSAYFKSSTTPNYFLTSADIALLAMDTGSYLYTKTTPQGTPYGWTLISRAYMFNPQYLEPTPTPTPTPPPSTPYLQYNESQYDSPGVFTPISCGGNISLSGVSSPWTLTIRVSNPGATDLNFGPTTIDPTNATLNSTSGPDATITPGNYSDLVAEFAIDALPANGTISFISDGTNPICSVTFNITS